MKGVFLMSQAEPTLDLLDSLARAIKIQEKRIAQSRELEEQMGFLSPATEKAIETLRNLQADWLKVAQALGKFPS